MAGHPPPEPPAVQPLSYSCLQGVGTPMSTLSLPGQEKPEQRQSGSGGGQFLPHGVSVGWEPQSWSLPLTVIPTMSDHQAGVTSPPSKSQLALFPGVRPGGSIPIRAKPESGR